MQNTLPSSSFQSSATAYDFWTLLKPRVMLLVVFTGVVGLVIAPGTIHPLTALIAILALALGSGASGALNMWYERDLDALMERTQYRPLPQGRIHPLVALAYGVTLAIGSVFLMYTVVNFWAAFYLAGQNPYRSIHAILKIPNAIQFLLHSQGLLPIC